MSDDLAMVLFYEERLNEEEVAAHAVAGHDSGRALREHEVKMAILQRWRPPRRARDVSADVLELMDQAETVAVDGIVRLLVSVYSDHEDYQHEWKP